MIPVVMGIVRAGIAVLGRMASVAGTTARGAAMRRSAMASASSAARPAAQGASYRVSSKVMEVPRSGIKSFASIERTPTVSNAVNQRPGAFENATRQAYRAVVDNKHFISHNRSSTSHVDNSQRNTTHVDNSTHVNNVSESGDRPSGSSEQIARASQLAEIATMAQAAKQGAQAIAGLAASAAYSSNRVHAWGLELSERQRHLTEYNGGIAASFAQLEFKRIGREIQRGSATEGSTKYMNTALDNLEQSLLPYSTAITNVVQNLAGALLEGVNSVIGGVEAAFLGAISNSPSLQVLYRAAQIWIGNQQQNQNNVWQNSTAQAMIDLAKQQPRRATPPPGGP